MKPNDVRKKLTTAQARLNQYNEEYPADNPTLWPTDRRPDFAKWLKGKFGQTVEERHGMKVPERNVGKPYTRVQHRNGGSR